MCILMYFIKIQSDQPRITLNAFKGNATLECLLTIMYIKIMF